jgi:hypothetical protein
MIVCPLTFDECSKHITLRPGAVFLMTPSKSKRSSELKQVISRISSELRRQSFTPLDGCSLVGLGDTVCSVCSTMQGCAMGIGFYHPDVPADALSNIFWEMGITQGWGRPVLLIANKKEGLPSDFTRGFSIFFENNRQYRRQFKELLQSFKQRERYYVDTLADEAIRRADYEKAFTYYQDAFLITGKRQIITKIRKLKDIINSERIPRDYKTRLTSIIATYIKDATASLKR